MKEKVIFDRQEVIEFLAKREKEMVESNARVVALNEKTEKLKREVEETNKKLISIS